MLANDSTHIRRLQYPTHKAHIRDDRQNQHRRELDVGAVGHDNRSVPPSTRSLCEVLKLAVFYDFNDISQQSYCLLRES